MNYIFALVIVLLSAITQGVCGFGFGLVSIPLLAIFFPIHDVIAAMLLHGTVLNTIVIVEARSYINLRRIWLLILFGILGIVPGVFALKILPANYVSIFIGVFIFLFSIALLTGFRKPFTREQVAMPITGFISGVLNGLITMSGPPVVLFLANQNEKKQTFRANLIVYFLILNLATIPVFIGKDIINHHNSLLALRLLPALIIGTIIGVFLHHKISENVFRKTAIVIVLISGLLSIFRGFGIF